MLNPEYADWVDEHGYPNRMVHIGFTDDDADVVVELKLTPWEAIQLKSMLIDSIRQERKLQGVKFLF